MSAHEVETRIDRAINRADREYLDGKLSREDWFARLGRIHIWADNMRTRVVFNA
jgi:hypothetical protein